MADTLWVFTDWLKIRTGWMTIPGRTVGYILVPITVAGINVSFEWMGGWYWHRR